MSNITLSMKRLNKIVKEEVKRHLLEEADQKDDIRELLDAAIKQMDEHGELIRDAALVTNSGEINPETLQRILKFQTNYVEELKKLQELLR